MFHSMTTSSEIINNLHKEKEILKNNLHYEKYQKQCILNENKKLLCVINTLEGALISTQFQYEIINAQFNKLKEQSDKEITKLKQKNLNLMTKYQKNLNKLNGKIDQHFLNLKTLNNEINSSNNNKNE